MPHRPQQIGRRRFLQASVATVGAAALSPAATFAASPNSKLRTAHIAVGGMGHADLNAIRSHPMVEVAALCDVDSKRLDAAAAQNPAAQTFVDYREMLDQLQDKIDAVVVSTPDHTHAPAAMRALLAGKPVYCQKPLTHNVLEARRLREVAEQKSLVTQMGVQIHSTAPYRRAVKLLQSGVIGKVSDVHAWSPVAWGYDKPQPPPAVQPPATLDWDLWLGVAAERPFAPDVYHPVEWRRMIDFGTGTLGDMGVHIFDTPYTALELTAPNWVQTRCRPPTGVGFPMKNKVEYEFPGTRYTTETVAWHWYDGAFGTADELDLPLPAGLTLPRQGSLSVGEAGMLLLPHIGDPVLLPEQKFADYPMPEVENGNHYHQWVDACLGRAEASVPFRLGGPLTEALLLGVVAGRFPDTRLEWDAEALRVTNHDEASALLKRDYRPQFAVEGLS